MARDRPPGTWDEVTSVTVPGMASIPAPSPRDRAFLVVMTGPSAGEMFRIDKARSVIGRGAQVDLRVQDEGVSREHCELVLDEGGVLVRDLGSRNGTFRNGVRIEHEVLAEGDKVALGPNLVVRLSYHDDIDEDFQRRMHDSSLRDELTRAFNRRYFLDRLRSEHAYAMRHNSAMSVLMLDLDHFRAVNERYGHPAGDRVLAQVSAAILRTIRIEDVLARVGGEEFAIVCRGTEAAQGAVVAERIRRTVAGEKVEHAGAVIAVTVSIGVATVPDPAILDLPSLIAAADHMLYDAKHAGRDCVRIQGVAPRA